MPGRNYISPVRDLHPAGHLNAPGTQRRGGREGGVNSAGLLAPRSETVWCRGSAPEEAHKCAKSDFQNEIACIGELGL